MKHFRKGDGERSGLFTRRALVLGHLLARFEDSAADLRRARELFAGSGDRVWEARALNLYELLRDGGGHDLLAHILRAA